MLQHPTSKDAMMPMWRYCNARQYIIHRASISIAPEWRPIYGLWRYGKHNVVGDESTNQ